MEKQELVLDINTDTFKELKDAINEKLAGAFQNMHERSITEADVGINLHISCEINKPGHFTKPCIKHEVKVTFKQQSKASGAVAPANAEMVYDEKIGKWVFRPLDDGQQDIFDGSKDDDVAQIEAPEHDPDKLPTVVDAELVEPDDEPDDQDESEDLPPENDESPHHPLTGTEDPEKLDKSKQCSHCKNSRSNGQARKTGPCVDCNEYSNFEKK